MSAAFNPVTERRGRFLQERPAFSFVRPRAPPFPYVFVVERVAAMSLRGLLEVAGATGGIEAGAKKGGFAARWARTPLAVGRSRPSFGASGRL